VPGDTRNVRSFSGPSTYPLPPNPIAVEVAITKAPITHARIALTTSIPGVIFRGVAVDDIVAHAEMLHHWRTTGQTVADLRTTTAPSGAQPARPSLT
jgi:hypothetical protein